MVYKGDEIINWPDACLMKDNVAYDVPLSESKEKIGIIRDYFDPVVVKDDEVLRNIHEPKNWPRVETLLTCVVVVQAKTRGSELAYGWYARVITEKDLTYERDANSRNETTLQHIPKQIYKQLLNFLINDEDFRHSSLLKHLPDADNARPLPVAPYNWSKRYTWSMLRKWLRTRCIVMYWMQKAAEKACAPGGAGRKRDLEAYQADFVTKVGEADTSVFGN